MRTVALSEAMEAIGPDRRIVASPGCGTPETLLAGIGEHADRVVGSRVYSGLLLGGYPFLDAVREGSVSYGTWHVMPAVRRLVADGTVDFYPVRGSQIPRMLTHLGVDIALIRVTPPDRHGFCNLGPSVSYPAGAIRGAELVVAEIDEGLPRTRGEGNVHVSEIDLAVPCERPPLEHPRARPDDVSRAIARHILELLPPAPTLQIGIGAIPEALVDELLAARVGELRFAGMAIDGNADLWEAGLLARVGPLSPPPIFAAELMGTRRLMDFAHENPAVGVYGAPVAVNARSLSAIDRFVSVNSIIEMDRRGQINAEWAGGRQVSSVGGGLDFVEAAIGSTDGMRIVAFASTNARDGSSRIVPALDAQAPATIPRSNVDYVVTEYGAVHLAFLTERERVEALAAIAHPDHRDALVDDTRVAA